MASIEVDYGVAELLELPVVFDVIVGDYGRRAAIEYVSMVRQFEDEVLRRILAPSKLPIMDEYRRIMFALVADVAYAKRSLIQRVASEKGFLDENVLIGLGASIEESFVERVAFLCMQQIRIAQERGYTRFRISIPCNGLSPLASMIQERLNDSTYAVQMLGQQFLKNDMYSVQTKTIPEVVLRHISKSALKPASLLVLGTEGVNAIYGSFASKYGFDLYVLAKNQYEILDEAIVAAISNDEDSIRNSRQQIESEIISVARNQVTNLQVIEACTDFSFGLGHSSLRLYALDMANSAYYTEL